MPEPLAAHLLYKGVDASRFRFATTADLSEPDEPLGQARAVAAVRFGIGIRRYGFNLFVLGPPGLGKQRFVRRFLEPRAALEAKPGDWCYVQDFKNPQRPCALPLPAGRGGALKAAVERLVAELTVALPAAFDSGDYRARRKLLDDEFSQRNAQPFTEIEDAAQQKNIALLRTPEGLGMAPLRDGQVMKPEEFKALPAEEREQHEAEMARLQERVQEVQASLPREARSHREALLKLDQEVAARTVGHFLKGPRAQFDDLPEVLAYFDALQKDVIAQLEELLNEGEEKPLEVALAGRAAKRALRRYEINLLVDNSGTIGAPVIYEDHPSLPNIVGRLDHRVETGNLISDYHMVRAGALHRANGGYLIVDVRKLLQQPMAWDQLKRVLRGGQIRIESLAQAMSLISAATIEPEPIPLNVKVVLLGERFLYHMLADGDPDFLELFKVAVDLEDSVTRSEQTEEGFAAHLGSLARRDGLRPLDAPAAARMVEHAARLAGDAERLSLETDTVLDLLGEADHIAGAAGRNAIGAPDVEQAIEAQTWRADRARERIHEEIRRGTILIDTHGACVGQVNALSVYHVGRYSFGRPSRVTARVRLGSGKVIDIEREVALGGPIHSKGVLILSGFLGARYAADRPLSLSASLVFEQSYGGIDGDSASCAELVTLLSAIAEVPILQSLAMTGSVNQQGEVQPVGGVNQKIEGFFDVCRQRGLAGDEGVLIPAANVKHLMLRADVVRAAEEGRFRIWAVETVDQAIEVLTGMPAGVRDGGSFPEGSFNGRVEARLTALAGHARDFARSLFEPPSDPSRSVTPKPAGGLSSARRAARRRAR